VGYLLRVLRVASYLAAALGLLLIFGATMNDALLFFGVRFLFMGVAGIGATSLLRDRYLEGTEEEEYNSLLPSPKVETPEEIQSVFYGWYGLTPGKKVLLVAVIVVSVLCMLTFYCDI
jgi:hypothetical protein